MPQCPTEESRLSWIPKPSAEVLVNEAVQEQELILAGYAVTRVRSQLRREAARRLGMLEDLKTYLRTSQTTEEAWTKYLLEWMTEPGAYDLVRLVMCQLD